VQTAVPVDFPPVRNDTELVQSADLVCKCRRSRLCIRKQQWRPKIKGFCVFLGKSRINFRFVVTSLNAL
jgi:hypothetical protein